MSRKPTDKPPILSEEDSALWDALAEGVEALPSKPYVPEERPAPPPMKTRTFRPQRSEENFFAAPLAFLEENNIDGVNHRTAQQVKQGKYPIDATLDLHGYTQDQAFNQLTRFLETAYEKELRCVLVITGKGRKGEEGQTQGGILRTQLPKWLNAPGNREKILLFHRSIIQHGGDGAVYVLLKRRRG